MKVVIDTNVFIAGFISHGLCYELLIHAATFHQILVSRSILKEVSETLRKKWKYTDTEGALLWVDQRCSFVHPVAALKKSVSRDKKDDHILALATQEDADLIISGDKDLLVLKKYQGIPILQPRDALQALME